MDGGRGHDWNICVLYFRLHPCTDSLLRPYQQIAQRNRLLHPEHDGIRYELIETKQRKRPFSRKKTLKCDFTNESKSLFAILQYPLLPVSPPCIRGYVRLASPSIFRRCARPVQPQQCYEVMPVHRPKKLDCVPLGNKCGQGEGCAEKTGGILMHIW